MGFINALTLVFVAAKLFGAIDWSWWLVFSPTLIHVGIALALFAALALKGIRR